MPRPPRFDYTMTTLPNGLQVVFLEDHSTPIVHAGALVPRRVEGREAGPHRVRASVRAPDVQGLAQRPARSAPVLDHERRRPGQRVNRRGRDGLLGDGAGAVPAARALARGRSDGLARRQRREVQDRARGRQGRAPDALREPAVRPAAGNHLRQGVHDASVQAPDDRQHARISKPRRSATCASSTPPTTCRTTRRSSLVGDFETKEAQALVEQYLGKVAARQAGAARHSEGAAAQGRRARSR